MLSVCHVCAECFLPVLIHMVDHIYVYKCTDYMCLPDCWKQMLRLSAGFIKGQETVVALPEIIDNRY